MNTSNLAIAVPVYIPSADSLRVGYFKRCLNNLALSSRHWPVYFAIDGGDILTAISLISGSGVRNYRITVNATSLGLGLNIHALRQRVFADGHDLMFLLEDDVVITYDLITLCSHVLDWASAGGTYPAITNSAVSHYADDPHAVIGDLIGWHHYLMPCSVYEMMQPALDEYAAFLTGVPYQQRPHAAIQEWLRTRFAQPATSTNQDNVNKVIASRLGIHRFSLARNRAIHTGEEGTNSTTAWHQQVGHSAQILHPHPNDTEQRYFNIIQPPSQPLAATSGS